MCGRSPRMEVTPESSRFASAEVAIRGSKGGGFGTCDYALINGHARSDRGRNASSAGVEPTSL